jgi:branched-chain amino acid transport system permease protein
MGQQIVSGLSAGASYALLALALVITMKTTKIPNFAMASMGLVPTYCIWWLITKFQAPYALALAAGLVVAFAVGWAIERTAIRGLAARSEFATVVMTIGLWFAINPLVVLLFGFDAHPFVPPYAGALHVGNVVVSYSAIVALLLSVLVAGMLRVFFGTRVGIEMKAVAESAPTARLLGVGVGTISGLAWGIASLVATLAVLLNVHDTVLHPGSGDSLIINGFVAATAGGFTSVAGAIIGGLVLGVIETLTAGYISSAAGSTITLIVIMAILLARPRGLVGEAAERAL